MSKRIDPNDPYDIKGTERDIAIYGCLSVIGVTIFLILIVCSIIDMR